MTCDIRPMFGIFGNDFGPEMFNCPYMYYFPKLEKFNISVTSVFIHNHKNKFVVGVNKNRQEGAEGASWSS